MIGIMNVPTDMPADFYASHTPTPSPTDKFNTPFRYTILRKKRAKPKISYMSDGRRLINGEPLICERPKHLWRDLFVRAFTLRIKTISDAVDVVDNQQLKVEMNDKYDNSNNNSGIVMSEDDDVMSNIESNSSISLDILDRIERNRSMHVELMSKRRSCSLDTSLRHLNNDNDGDGGRPKRELRTRMSNWIN